MSALQDPSRSVVSDLVARVRPVDAKEAADQADILTWIGSGAPLFRVRKPDVPPKHLAVYCALLDDKTREVMVVDHVKADSWLLPGGHVDPDEDPRHTAEREIREELAISPKFHDGFGEQPLFLSVTQTRGEGSHIDVTLWFVLMGDRTQELCIDEREARSVEWLAIDDPAVWVKRRLDPQMHRFLSKLTTALMT